MLKWPCTRQTTAITLSKPKGMCSLHKRSMKKDLLSQERVRMGNTYIMRTMPLMLDHYTVFAKEEMVNLIWIWAWGSNLT